MPPQINEEKSSPALANGHPTPKLEEATPEPRYGQQSPINLTDDISSTYRPDVLSVHWSPRVTAIQKSSDHGLKILFKSHRFAFVTIGGKKYHLKEFHFHHPSEHYVDGQRFDMELHIVHQNVDDLSIAVIGILIEANGSPGGDHVAELCECLLDHESGDRFEFSLDPKDWLPDDRSTFYRYEGSLTTPPYAETVTWSVLGEPMKISKVDLKKLVTQAELAGHAARDLQPLERRYVVQYTGAGAAFGTEPAEKTMAKRSKKA